MDDQKKTPDLADASSRWTVAWGEPFNFYRDDVPSTRWSRFKWRWSNRLRRVRDAWDVLLGRAFVDDY